MAVSQNGWSVISSSQLNKNPFPGTNIVPVPGVRIGDVATVLHYVGTQFNNRVEKLVNPGCWGYANRPIAGSTATSNHASGTAIDLNAPKHPMGKANTFTTAQVAQIRQILAFLEGAVRWGGDYARKDDMHFEINANSATVTRIANKIKGNPQGGGQVVDKEDLDRIYQYGPLGRLRGAGEGENVYLGKKASFVIQDHANSKEAKDRAAARTKELADLRAEIAQLKQNPPATGKKYKPAPPMFVEDI